MIFVPLIISIERVAHNWQIVTNSGLIIHEQLIDRYLMESEGSYGFNYKRRSKVTQVRIGKRHTTKTLSSKVLEASKLISRALVLEFLIL